MNIEGSKVGDSKIIIQSRVNRDQQDSMDSINSNDALNKHNSDRYNDSKLCIGIIEPPKPDLLTTKQASIQTSRQIPEEAALLKSLSLMKSPSK